MGLAPHPAKPLQLTMSCGAVNACRTHSAKHPDPRVSEKDTVALSAHRLQLDLSVKGLFSLAWSREFKFGKLLNPRLSCCSRCVCKQPGLRNQNHMVLTCPEGAVPHPLAHWSALMESGRRLREPSHRNACFPGRDLRPQQSCNLMNCQHLGHNY